MACARHTFNNPGCLACNVVQTNKVTRSQNASQHRERMGAQANHAARVDARMGEQNALLAQQNQIAVVSAVTEAFQRHQQTKILSVEAERANAYRFSQYTQSEHGQAFLKWETEATRLRNAIESVDQYWLDAWTSAAAEAAGPLPQFQDRVDPGTPSIAKRALIVGGSLLAGSFVLWQFTHANQPIFAPYGFEQLMRDTFLVFAGFAGIIVMASAAFLPVRAERKAAVQSVDRWIRDYNARLVEVLGGPYVQVARTQGPTPAAGSAGGVKAISGPVPGGPGLVLHVSLDWTTQQAQAYKQSLEQFIRQARETFPAPEHFPALWFPQPIATDARMPEPVSKVLAMLEPQE